jgi:ABC-2 type transport system ATP-binding protein
MVSTIDVQGLSHDFRRFRRTTRALDAVSLSVQPGTIFGLLGRNGAGKTTLVKILLGLIHPTSGSARILGAPPSSHRMRRRIGYLPEQMRLPEHMKASASCASWARSTEFPKTSCGSACRRCWSCWNSMARGANFCASTPRA